MFIGVNAVAQGCCQLVWHSKTEEQGMHFAISSADSRLVPLQIHLWNFALSIGVQ